MSREIDLNADLGEGAGFDAELLALVTSANVCCGAHAGGVAESAETLRRAHALGVAVGAHPGYPDREHFGRRELPFNEVIVEECVAQVGALVALARLHGTTVRYLKPHGALYNQAARDRQFADAVVSVARFFGLPLLGLPGSAVESQAGGVPFFVEGFADRGYRPDGSLVPRTKPGAFVHDPEQAVAQVEWLVREKRIRTVCVHGDNPDAVAFARAVRAALLARGFTLKAFA